MSSDDESSSPSTKKWDEKNNPFPRLKSHSGGEKSINKLPQSDDDKKLPAYSNSCTSSAASSSLSSPNLNMGTSAESKPISSENSKSKQKERHSFNETKHSKPSKKNKASSSHGNNNAEDPAFEASNEETNANLRILVDRLSHYYDVHRYHHSSSSSPSGKSNSSNAPIIIDKRRAYYLLEAAAGNVDLAVSLYWEDFAASSSNVSVSTNTGNAMSSKTGNRSAHNVASRNHHNGRAPLNVSRPRSKRQRVQANSKVNSSAASLTSSARSNQKLHNRLTAKDEDGDFSEHTQQSADKKKPAVTSKGASENATSKSSTPNQPNKLNNERKTSDDDSLRLHELFSARDSKCSSNVNHNSSSASHTKKPSTNQSNESKGNKSTDASTDMDRSRSKKVLPQLLDRGSDAHAFVPRRLNPDVRLPLRRLDMFQRLEVGRGEEERRGGGTAGVASAGLGEAFEYFQKSAQNHSQPTIASRARESNASANESNNSNSNSTNNANYRSNMAAGADHEDDNNNQEENEDADTNKNSVSISDDEAAATARFSRIFNDLDDEDGNEEVDSRHLRNNSGSKKRDRRKHRSLSTLLRAKQKIRDKLKRASRDGHRKRLREEIDDNLNESTNDEGDDDTVMKDPPNANEDAEEFSDSDSESSTDFAEIASKGPSTVIWGKPSTTELTESPSSNPLPKTWKNAYFSLSPSRNGLQIQLDAQSQLNQKVCSSHCGGFSALASLVSALIQSGASIQGQQVSCGKNQVRFSDLSKSEKARQFNSRLADALASLLFIAAQASIAHHKATAERKKKKFQRKGNKYRFTADEEKILERTFQRELKVCSVCKWAESTNGQRRATVGEIIASSSTNVLDLKPYVLSQLGAFTRQGGCALFLETIVKIHGESRIRRMLRSTSGKDCLISCDCGSKEIPKGKSKIEWLDFLGHSCVSVELISLLMTGKIHSSYEGWDAHGLGVGILGLKNSLPVDKRLMNPSKPVWIVRGEKCFSFMWLDDENDINYIKERGSAFTLVHWNCWGSGKRSIFKVITSRQTSNIDLSSRESLELDLKKISHHVEDERFYSEQYRRWRFTFGDLLSLDEEKESKDSMCKDVQKEWIPYFRLDQKLKMMVDMKYAPNINMTIWSKWMEATVVLCTPTTPPVV